MRGRLYAPRIDFRKRIRKSDDAAHILLHTQRLLIRQAKLGKLRHARDVYGGLRAFALSLRPRRRFLRLGSEAEDVQLRRVHMGGCLRQRAGSIFDFRKRDHLAQ